MMMSVCHARPFFLVTIKEKEKEKRSHARRFPSRNALNLPLDDPLLFPPIQIPTNLVVFSRVVFVGVCLATETIQRPALALEGVDDVQRSDGLALGVFGVGDGVADDAFEEGFEHAAGFFVDHCKGQTKT